MAPSPTAAAANSHKRKRGRSPSPVERKSQTDSEAAVVGVQGEDESQKNDESNIQPQNPSSTASNNQSTGKKKLSFFSRKRVKKAFQPRENETVQEAMARRQLLFEGIIQDFSKYRSVIDPEGGDDDRLTTEHQQKIVVSCMLLRKAYLLLQANADENGMNWQGACTLAMNQAKEWGMQCPTNVQTLMRHHHCFVRNNDKFPHPVKKKDPAPADPPFFQAHPLAKQQFVDYLQHRVTGQDEESGVYVVENTSGRELLKYFVEQIVPEFLRRYNEQQQRESGAPPCTQEDFLEKFSIKKVTFHPRVVCEWCRRFGFRIKRDYSKCINLVIKARMLQEQQQRDEQDDDDHIMIDEYFTAP